MLDDTLWQMGKSAEKHSNPTYMTRIAESKEFRAFLHATAEHAPSETIALFNALVDECHASQKILDKAADATRKAAAAQKTLEEAEAAKNQKADASQDAVRPTKRFKHTHQPATTFQPIQTIVGPSTIRVS
jgi:parvulin-like peptidyl-prolyl isomerase